MCIVVADSLSFLAVLIALSLPSSNRTKAHEEYHKAKRSAGFKMRALTTLNLESLDDPVKVQYPRHDTVYQRFLMMEQYG